MEGHPGLLCRRSNLAKTGVVFTALFRDSQSLKLFAAPKICAYGLLFRKDVSPEETLEEEAEQLVESVYAEASRREDLEEVLRVELRRFFRKRVSHKPVVIPVILEV